jgi:hypothetical protein
MIKDYIEQCSPSLSWVDDEPLFSIEEFNSLLVRVQLRRIFKTHKVPDLLVEKFIDLMIERRNCADMKELLDKIGVDADCL